MAYKSVIYLYFIFLINASSSDENVCEQKSACICQFDNGITLDISKVIPDDGQFISGNNGNLTYYYHGCTDVSPETIHIEDLSFNNCVDKASLCLFNLTDRSFLTLGNAVDSKYVIDKDNPKLHEIVYTTNKTVNTIIKLICAPELDHTELLVKSSTKSDHTLELLSHEACRGYMQHGLSTGSKLLIMFLVGFMIYLIGGAALLYFVRGARGKEIIPNIDFWCGLPALVRDGIIFVMNGCNPQVVPTADTYDRI